MIIPIPIIVQIDRHKRDHKQPQEQQGEVPQELKVQLDSCAKLPKFVGLTTIGNLAAGTLVLV